MSTRGAYGFKVNGKNKVTYNHSDSYPSYLGVNVLSFIRDVSDVELKEIANEIRLIDGDSTPTDEEIAVCNKLNTFNFKVSTGSQKEWYCLLREAQGNLNLLKKSVDNGYLKFMIDSEQFFSDSLYCEYAYIMDVDSKRLNIYRGVQLAWSLPFSTARKLSDDEFVKKIESGKIVEEIEEEIPEVSKKQIEDDNQPMLFEID